MGQWSIETMGAFEIPDLRGYPALRVIVAFESGRLDVALVPFGASTAHHEAIELRDGDPREMAAGVLRTVRWSGSASQARLKGQDAGDPSSTGNRSTCRNGEQVRLRHNGMLDVSMA